METATATVVDVFQDAEREEVREGWRCESIEDADWCLRRIAQLNAERAEVDRMEAAEIARIKLRADKLREKVDRGVGFFTGHVRAFAEANRDVLLKGGKAKSRKLLYGTIGWRERGGAPEVKDETLLLTWAQRQPPESGFLRIKEEAAWSEIKRHIKQTGEVPPGVEFTEQTTEFFVKGEE